MTSTLITARHLITATRSGAIALEHAGVVFNALGQITHVGPADTLLASGKHTDYTAHIDLPNHILAPGLVNAHCHAAMSLLRGAADDLPLQRWLNERIWPMETALVDEPFVRIGTQLAATEMLLGGTTTCVDMYFYSSAAAQSFLSVGMRAVLALPVIEFASRYASDVDAYITVGLQARDQFIGEPLLSFALAPHAPYTASDATFQRVLAYANELGIPVHTHLQETAIEVQEALAATHERPTARLARLGVLSPDFFAAHCVHLDVSDIALLAQHGASVVHCPSSNLKLASGLAPIAAMLNAGINVGLGTDGAASNNRLDMFEEMRLAALIGKVQANNAAAVTAAQAFTLATLGGAQAAGIGAVTGSVEIGKAADLIAVSLDAPGLQPLFDPISHFVYAASRADVSHVWVAGQSRVTDHKPSDALAQALTELPAQILTFTERVKALRT
jgi:5-methylthioadenosine/S-adenosylhomocysteine deaminase